MRFGTYYFLQAPPALAHPEVVRREIEQMAWTEELGFDSIWLTEHHFIEYGLSVSPAVLAAAAAMRPRRLRGPVDQPSQSRDTYVRACRKGGRTEAEIARLLGNWGVSRHVYVAPTDAEALAEAKDAELWYQEALRRFLIPEQIERVHPLLQPGFRAMAERLGKVTWDQLVAETVAFGSPDTVAEKIDELWGLGVGEVLCWMNFGGLPQAGVRRSMELFAREVMPRFR